MQPEYKRLGTYQCRRATGNFRGREYEAWYTLDIPVSSGPFKLGGLPGLILEAKTLDGTAEFLFQSIEISPETPGLIKAPQGFVPNMNFDQYNKANKAHTEKIEREFRAKGYDVSASVVTYRLELFDADSKK